MADLLNVNFLMSVTELVEERGWWRREAGKLAGETSLCSASYGGAVRGAPGPALKSSPCPRSRGPPALGCMGPERTRAALTAKREWELWPWSSPLLSW